MAGEGNILRNARVDKGWSLTQAEEITKIRIRYLEALEEEEYHILPGPTYTKGFIRTYAKHLGLNPDEVLALYKASEEKQEKIATYTPPPSSSIQRKKPQWVKPALLVFTGVVALVAVFGIATLSKKPNNSLPPDNIATPLPTAPQEEVVEPPANNTPVTPTPQENVAQESDELVAKLTFVEPCWVRIYVDGQPALEGTFDGVVKELKAKEKIELVTVGNAGGLAITLNGKDWPSLGASGQVVNNIVFEKDRIDQEDSINQVSLVP